MGQACLPKTNYKCIVCGYVSKRNSCSNNSAQLSQHQCVRPQPILSCTSPSTSTPKKHQPLLKPSHIDPHKTLKLKFPINAQNTHFKYHDQQLLTYPDSIAQIPRQLIKQGTFQEKIGWFRARIERVRGQYRHGVQVVRVDRGDLIGSSWRAMQGVNVFRLVRVEFLGEMAEDAGGGLLREWMHLCIKQIFSPQSSIFKQSNTDQTTYSLVPHPHLSQQAKKSLQLLGFILAKSLIQKIPINCPLDFTILRQLCCQPVHLSDVYSYDKCLYRAWRYVLECGELEMEQLGLDGTVEVVGMREEGDSGELKEGSTDSSNQNEQQPSKSYTQTIQLFPNGTTTPITPKNRNLYLKKIINFYCTQQIQPQLTTLERSLHERLPRELLSIFEPYQLSMLVNGRQGIDLGDWRRNTVYDGYQGGDAVVGWFWEIVGKYGEQGWRNLLHYCTGSARVPIQGFAYLETNHGHIMKFSIRKTEYSPDNQYPISFTCFNRLHLPNYGSKKQMEEKIAFMLLKEVNQFGLG